jgi:cobalt-zinc-cadmium efflux system protein
MAHEQHHEHGRHPPPADFGPAFAAGTILNIALVAAQVVFGLAAGSMALLADAAHNAGDVLGLVLAWGATILARRSPTAERTYGWGRGSILAALINASVLLISVGAITVEAVHRLFAPVPVAEATVMWVAAAGIAVNGGTALLFLRGQEDLNIRATFLHMAGDAAISAGVVAAAAIIAVTGWFWIDPLASLLIAAAITVSTWGLLRESANLAMDAVPPRLAGGEVEAWLGNLPGVVEVHDLHIWALSTTEAALTAHLVCTEGADSQSLIHTAAHGLGEHFHIGHATLQVETPAVAETCRLRPADVV